MWKKLFSLIWSNRWWVLFIPLLWMSWYEKPILVWQLLLVVILASLDLISELKKEISRRQVQIEVIPVQRCIRNVSSKKDFNWKEEGF